VTSEWVLIHLSSYSKFQEERLIPVEASQSGICEELDISQSALSEALHEIISKGFIEEEKRYVKGLPDRRKVYFLTKKGFVERDRLMDGLMKLDVKVRNDAGHLVEVSLNEVNRHLGRKYSLMEIARNITLERVVNIKALEEQVLKKREEFLAPRDFSNTIPKAKPLFGRENQLKELGDWSNDSSSPVLVLTGIGGSGKTQLVSNYISNTMDESDVMWYRVLGWSTEQAVLNSLGNHLARKGKPTLQMYLKSSSGKTSLKELKSILSEESMDEQILFVFDDVHLASEEVFQFISSFIEIMIEGNRAKCILIGRMRPDFLPSSDFENGKTLKEMSLESLDEIASHRFLGSLGIKDEDVGYIYSRTQWHPLSLELIASSNVKMKLPSIKGTGKVDITEMVMFIQREIIEELSPEERRVLEVASVFRYPVYPDAFFLKQEYNEQLLDSLIKRSLLRSYTSNVFDLHDTIKSYLKDHLTESRIVSYHKIAIDYYSNDESVQSNIETIYHLLEIEGVDGAREILLEKKDIIINSTYIKNLSELLSRETWKKLNPLAMIDVLLVKIDVMINLGEWNVAKEEIKKALSLARENDLHKQELLFNTDLVRLNFYQEEWEDCISLGDKVSDEAEKLGMQEIVAFVNYWIGSCYSKTGQTEKSIRFLKEGLRISEELQKEELIQRYRLGLSGSLSYSGRYEEAMIRRIEVIQSQEGDRTDFNYAAAHNNQGFQQLTLLRYDEALHHLKKALEIGKLLGRPYIIIISTISMAFIYAKRGDIIKAENECQAVEPIVEHLGYSDPVASIHLVRAVIWTRVQAWDIAAKYFEKSIETFEESNLIHEAARSSYEYALMLKYKGDLLNQKKLLKKSYRLFKQLGNRYFVKKIEGTLLKLEETNQKTN